MGIESPSPPAATGARSDGRHFHRKLGLFDATTLVAGSMVGSGIFVVSAVVAQDVGSSGWLMAIWILTGILTIMGALCYVELSAMMPHAGGQYVYLREAYSPLWGFLYGWTLFLVIQTGFIAAILVAFGKFLGVLVPELGPDNVILGPYRYHWPGSNETLTILGKQSFEVNAGQLVAAGIVIFLTLLNCFGVEAGKLVQNVFTVAKTLALVALIVIGLTLARDPEAIRINTSDLWSGITQTLLYQEVSRHALVPSWPTLIALMVAGGAMIPALFAADAWNNVTFTGGEIKNPNRTLPLSMVLGTGFVITLYLLANLAYLAALPVNAEPGLEAKLRELDARITRLEKEGKDGEAQAAREERNALVDNASPFDRGIARAKQERVGTAVLEGYSKNLAVPFIAIAIMISAFGCANGIILGGARLLYAMARDSLFFQAAGRLNGWGVPAAALILQGVWAIFLIFSGTYSDLLNYVIFATLLFYVLTVVGLFVLRWKRPEAERPYRTFGYPVLPAIYVILCTAIMLNLLIVKPIYTWPGLIIVLSGIPVYFLWQWSSGGRKVAG